MSDEPTDLPQQPPPLESEEPRPVRANPPETPEKTSDKKSMDDDLQKKRSIDDFAMVVAALACIVAGVVLAFYLVQREYRGTAAWVAAISFVVVGGMIVVLRHVELYGNDGRRRLILRREPEEYGAQRRYEGE